jgi:hypothetical protein
MHARTALATAPVLVLLWLGIALYLVDKHHTDLDRAAQESRNLAQSFEENIRRTVEAIDTASARCGPPAPTTRIISTSRPGNATAA